jgi:hypothetical protein
MAVIERKRRSILCSLILAVVVMSGLAASAHATPTWTLKTAVTPAGATQADLRAVSCPTSITSCVAVGSSNAGGGSALGQSWNGTSWALENVVTYPTGGAGAVLTGVSCPTSTSTCFAVGSYFSGGAQIAFAEAKSTSTWSTQVIPDTSSPNNGALFAVSCSSTTSCEATGQHQFVHWGPSAFHWNGTAWTYDPVNTLPAGYSKNGVLTGVSCPVSSTFCVANGQYGDTGNTARPLAELKSGSGLFAPETMPSISSTHHYITGTSCVSSGFCATVGRYSGTSIAGTRNGTTWTLAQTPLPGAGTSNAQFFGVSCTSASMCIAVGSYVSASGVTVPLATRWDGSVWWGESAPTAPVGATSATLSAISCTATNTCVAVGSYTTAGSANKPLAYTLTP